MKTYLIRVELNEGDNYENFSKKMQEGGFKTTTIIKGVEKKIPHTTFIVTSQDTAEQIAEKIEKTAKSVQGIPTDPFTSEDPLDLIGADNEPPKVYVVEIIETNNAGKNLKG